MYGEYPWRKPKPRRTSEEWQKLIDEAVRSIDGLHHIPTNSAAILELAIQVKKLTEILQTLTNRERVIEQLEDAEQRGNEP